MSVQDQTCGDAGQEGVPVCLRPPRPGEENMKGHFSSGLDVLLARVWPFYLMSPLLVEFGSGERCGEVRCTVQVTGIHTRCHDPPM